MGLEKPGVRWESNVGRVWSGVWIAQPGRTVHLELQT